MVQLHSLMKFNGIQLISLPQYQYEVLEYYECRSLDEKITSTVAVLLSTLWNESRLLRTDIIILTWGFRDKFVLEDIVAFYNYL